MLPPPSRTAHFPYTTLFRSAKLHSSDSPFFCPSAISGPASLFSHLFEVLTFLNFWTLSHCAPRFTQASHSREVILTRLGRFFAPRCGRSVISTCPSRRASCMAFCTVV